ncbi:hypothetical protein PILCRDRAFT_816202 [Piloderma croceum F 1598]|uniref:Uncharacterized protein n=1 Tax=Piloderma croceum (strain F 1598) TaxID=765440 RepID=A0A0C3C984_PILCF|nr:hypothetical protein PILCRDRAFT_816202 [Piloderma croceum F 1598]
MENTTGRSTVENATNYVHDNDVILDPSNAIDEGTHIVSCVSDSEISTGHKTLVDFPTIATEAFFALPLPATGSEGHRDRPRAENCCGDTVSDPSDNQQPGLAPIAAPIPVYPRVPQSSVHILESNFAPSTCHQQVNNENGRMHNDNKVPLSHIAMPPRSRTPPPCPPPPPPSPVSHIDDVTHLVQPPPLQIGVGIGNAAWRKVAAKLRVAYSRLRAPCSRVFTTLVNNGRDHHAVEIKVYVTCERFVTFECQRD